MSNSKQHLLRAILVWSLGWSLVAYFVVSQRLLTTLGWSTEPEPAEVRTPVKEVVPAGPFGTMEVDEARRLEAERAFGAFVRATVAGDWQEVRDDLADPAAPDGGGRGRRATAATELELLRRTDVRAFDVQRVRGGISTPNVDGVGKTWIVDGCITFRGAGTEMKGLGYVVMTLEQGRFMFSAVRVLQNRVDGAPCPCETSK